MRYLLLLSVLAVLGCTTPATTPLEGVAVEFPRQEYRFIFESPGVFVQEGRQVVKLEGLVEGSAEELNRDSRRGALFYKHLSRYPFLVEVLNGEGRVVERAELRISRYRRVAHEEAECRLYYSPQVTLEPGFTVRFSSLKVW